MWISPGTWPRASPWSEPLSCLGACLASDGRGAGGGPSPGRVPRCHHARPHSFVVARVCMSICARAHTRTHTHRRVLCAVSSRNKASKCETEWCGSRSRRWRTSCSPYVHVCPCTFRLLCCLPSVVACPSPGPVLWARLPAAGLHQARQLNRGRKRQTGRKGKRARENHLSMWALPPLSEPAPRAASSLASRGRRSPGRHHALPSMHSVLALSEEHENKTIHPQHSDA